MRDPGRWRDGANQRVTVVRKEQVDEIAAAKALGDIICTVLSGSEMEKGSPARLPGTPYAAFAEATKDIRVCFVTGNPVVDPMAVVTEAALGMMDNDQGIWR